uniref:Uncharacterized protein n=1 Tax=Ascaris lumbricoides TaxID=6252 RepID=A0A0M3HGM5_ASCLU
MEIEKQYVHEVYSRLASHCAETESKKKLRIWPNVKKFIDELPPGSIVIDVGETLCFGLHCYSLILYF